MIGLTHMYEPSALLWQSRVPVTVMFDVVYYIILLEMLLIFSFFVLCQSDTSLTLEHLCVAQ